MSDPLGLISGSGIRPIAPLQVPGMTGPAEASGASFKDALMQEIENVNKLQAEAENAIQDLASGQRDDYANVMLAKNKADIAFQMLMQVRNKLVDAYNEIEQIRV